LCTFQININHTVTNSDDIGVVTLPATQVTVPAKVTLSGISGTVQLSPTPAGGATGGVSIDQQTLALTDGTPVTINITPLQQSQAPNDVRIAGTLNGIQIGQATMTVATIIIPRIFNVDTPAGMPDRIPPRVNTPINITLQPNLGNSGQSVTLATSTTTN
jgi:hypothetical protein